MRYPTMQEVESASHFELAVWARHLDSPGLSAPEGQSPAVAEATRSSEAKIQGRILERFNAAGGWNPTLSKAVGWERR